MITSVANFRSYGPGAAFVDLTDGQIEFHLASAEGMALGYIGGRGYDAAIASADKDLQTAIFKIAAWDLVVGVRGVNPADPGHASMKMQRDEAVSWLKDVARGLANLAGASAPARARTGTASIVSTSDDDETSRGW